jgi:hypothetical protein
MIEGGYVEDEEDDPLDNVVRTRAVRRPLGYIDSAERFRIHSAVTNSSRGND